MRISKLLAAMLVLAGGASLAARSADGQVRQKAAAEEEARPLIRMDLLRAAPAPSGPPKRNIFSPRTGPASRPESTAPPAGTFGARDPNLPPDGADAAGPVTEAQTPTAPVFSVDLRYIGFVDSQRTGKIIGLVVFHGQALAVLEGEVISEGIRVGKISRTAIEVVLPDSSTRAFSLEGEEE